MIFISVLIMALWMTSEDNYSYDCLPVAMWWPPTTFTPRSWLGSYTHRCVTSLTPVHRLSSTCYTGENTTRTERYVTMIGQIECVCLSLIIRVRMPVPLFWAGHSILFINCRCLVLLSSCASSSLFSASSYSSSSLSTYHSEITRCWKHPPPQFKGQIKWGYRRLGDVSCPSGAIPWSYVTSTTSTEIKETRTHPHSHRLKCVNIHTSKLQRSIWHTVFKQSINTIDIILERRD